MMAVTDSGPIILQTIQDSLVAAGLDAISEYGFSSCYVPGQTEERPFVEAMTIAIGRDLTVGELAALRRLLHESYSRVAKQQGRLTGLQIHGNPEPSDRLVDVAVSLCRQQDILHRAICVYIERAGGA